MSTQSNDLVKYIRIAIEQLPASTVSTLCNRLDRIDVTNIENEYALIASTVFPTTARQTVSNLLNSALVVRDNCPAQSLAWALRGAQSTARILENSSGTLELVWTGPSGFDQGLRRTDQALLDIVEGAQSSLLIVTFTAYRMPHFLAALSRALERSVKVSLIMESAQESEGKIRFEATNAIGLELLKRFELYYWPLDRRTRDSADRYGSLHAKCAVADNSVALVSSANLTEYAMSLNMELGIVIRGGDVPRNICTHFRRLMDDGHLLPLQIMP